MENGTTELELRHGIQALSRGAGTTVIMLPGWPQTAEAYEDLLPEVSARYRCLALNPPGVGGSSSSAKGYSTAAVSSILADAAADEGEARYHLVGHDVGAWIAYAWAAQYPERVKSLTVFDSAIPGFAAPRTFPLPYEQNIKLWQFSFNTLPELPEILTKGKERELLNWLFDKKAQHPERISPERRARYVDCYARQDAMSQGFAYYRSAAQSAQENRKFSQKKLAMPVLALGGATGVGDSLRQSMEALADSVEGGALEDCGHYLMEEQPEQVTERLLDFLKRSDGQR